MKNLLPFIGLIISLSVYSQVPSYYNDVNINLSGNALKEALATKVISSHTTYISYTPGVWEALKQCDVSPTDPTKVVLIYGWNDADSDIVNDRTRGKDNHGGGTGVWNREHVYPKSLGNPNLGTSGVGADAHNLRPADAQRNSSRSSRKFAAGNGTESYITSEGHWYPGDEWKGDVARMLMYMYLHYGNQTLPKNVAVGVTNSNDANMINLLLEWNAEDPVSELEIQRNPVLQNIQGNRNPFIDNPAFATKIWGGPQAQDRFGNTGGSDTQAPTIPTNLTASNITQNTVNLTWTASTDNVSVTGYDVFSGSTKVASTTNTSTTITGLSSSTNYSFSVKAKDAAGNLSSNSVAVNVSTLGTPSNGTVTDLLISEYVEGSSNNKAIEIANFTGSTVNLANYSIKKATNGSGSWTNTLNLTGELQNGKVYVIVNSSATSSLKNKAQLTNTSVMGFNGNDAIALFKGNTLIDLVGNQNSSSNFGKDVTLQRKSSIKSPNTTYTSSEWNVLANNTFSGLGEHIVDGETPDTQAPTNPTNLTAANVTENSVNLSWTASTDNKAVSNYDVFQNNTKIATVNSTNYNVTGLNASSNYTFYIKAKDEAGNISDKSNTIGITTKAPSDNEAPTSPSNLTVSNVTTNSVDLSWTVSTDNVAVTGYDVYQANTKIATVTTSNYRVIGLNASSNYTFYIKAKDNAGNISEKSNTIGATTKAIVLNYCSSKGDNSSYEFIDNVIIGGIANSTTANNGYGNFTSLVGNLSSGSNTIILSAGFTSSSYTEHWAVWIDFNQNGTFETSEKVVSGSSSSSGNLSYTFNVPSTAKNGNTRMRVSMKWDSTPTPCETIPYGEVEDYTVSIGSSARSSFDISSFDIEGELGNEPAVFSTEVYPNPTVNNINLKITDNRYAEYKLINMIGQTVKSGEVTRNSINVSNLQSGMYILEVNDGTRSFTKKILKK